MPSAAAASSMPSMPALTEDSPVQDPPVHVEITASEFRHDRARREWLMIGLALSVLITLMAIVVAVFAMVGRGEPAAAPVAARAGREGSARAPPHEVGA